MGIFDRFKKGNKISVERDKSGTYSYSINEEAFTNNADFMKMSLDNPILFSILSLRSKMVSQMKIKHVNSKGVEIDNSEVLKLLNEPNYFQSQEDFLFQLSWFMGATGNNYCYKYQPFKTQLPNALYNLVPSELDFKEVQKLNYFVKTQAENNNFTKQTVTYKLDDTTHKFELNTLIPFYDIANGLTPNTWIQSPSRVQGICKNLDNINENLKSKNINLKMSQKYLGVNKNNVQGVSTPLKAEDKTNIEKILGSKSIQLTNGDIEFKHLVSNMKNLGLDVMLGQDAQICLLAFGLNNDVLNYFAGGSSTFENQEKGELRAFQNEIQTLSNNICNSLASGLGLTAKNESLIATYDHLPIMQAVILEKINSLKVQQEALKVALENGTIEIKEAKRMTSEFIERLKL